MKRAKNHSLISYKQAHYSQYIPEYERLLMMIQKAVKDLKDLSKYERKFDWFEDR